MVIAWKRGVDRLRVMINRRDFLSVCIAAPLGVAMPCVAGNRIAFRIRRKGSVIGAHTLDFAPRDDGFDVAITIDIAVRFGPIPLYHYRMRGVEQWRDGVVSFVEATTDDDGKTNSLRCERDAGGLWVTGSKQPRYRAPADALPASHWNIAELNGPWISLQDGRLFHPEVTLRGEEPALLADGTTVPARHYNLSGDVQLDLWYDDAERWAGLGFTASDGSLIRYERLVT